MKFIDELPRGSAVTSALTKGNVDLAESALAGQPPTLVEPRLLITAAEAASILAISPRKLWSMTNAGQVPCIRMGRAVRYCPTALREWVERSVS